MKSAVGYLRRSDRKQQDNTSLEYQRNQILALASQLDYHIISWAVDDCVSAYKKQAKDRQGIQNIVSVVKEKKIQAIFFYDESRVSRQTFDFVVQVYLPMKNEDPELEFYKSTSPDPWDPYQVPAIITLIYAQYESQMKAKRVKDSQMQLVNPGNGVIPIRPATRVAYGYEKDFAIISEEACTVEFIFRLASVGYSNERISLLLTDAGIPSPTGKEWNPNTIDHILSNRLYLGDFIWCETLISNQYFEPIISVPLWNQVQEIKRLKSKYKKFNTSFSLKGVIYCEECDIQLECKDVTPGKSQNKYLFYACPTCKAKISVEDIHELIRKRAELEWQNHYNSYFNIQGKHIKRLLKQLTDKKASITEELYKTRSIAPKDKSRPDYNVLIRSREIHESVLSFRLVQVNEAIDNVQELLEYQGHPDTRNYFAKCDLSSLTSIEFRTFCLLTYSKVVLRWKGQNEINVQIEYRLHPTYIDEVID